MALKTKIVLLLSVLVALYVLSSVKSVHLENGTHTELRKTGPLMKIEIGKDVMQRFPKYFNQSYPLEYATCIYGTKNNETIRISYDEVFMTYQTERSVGAMCPATSKGLLWLGTVHSHPAADPSWCVLSDADMANNFLVAGLQCKDTILFYARIDGYSRGYYADEI